MGIVWKNDYSENIGSKPSLYMFVYERNQNWLPTFVADGDLILTNFMDYYT